MTLDLADFVGLAGGAVLVAAFPYPNLSKAMNLSLFNLLKPLGALALLASPTVHFNIGLMALEVVWGAIALFGMASALATRSRA